MTKRKVTAKVYTNKSKISYGRGPRGPRGFRGFPGPVGPTGPKGESAMAKESETQKDIEPGLHVRRWREGPLGEYIYQIVKVISTDEGRGACLSVHAVNEGYEVSLFDIERSDFQRIKE